DAVSLRQAVEKFTRATDADPLYAPGWAWLSIAQDYLAEDGAVRANEAMPESRDAAERAVALDANSSDSQTALGIVRLQYDWEWSEAKAAFDRALELSPGSAFVRYWRARWLESQNRVDDALAELQKTLEFDPLSPEVLAAISISQSSRGQHE